MTSGSVLPIRKQLRFSPGGGSAGQWHCSYCCKLVAFSGQGCEAPYLNYLGSWPFRIESY